MTDWTQPFPFDDPTKTDLTIKTPLWDGGPRPQSEVETLRNKVWSAEELLATDFPSPSVIERLREWTANTIWRVAGWLDTLAEWVDCP